MFRSAEQPVVDRILNRLNVEILFRESRLLQPFTTSPSSDGAVIPSRSASNIAPREIQLHTFTEREILNE